jgi:hypothetical protein
MVFLVGSCKVCFEEVPCLVWEASPSSASSLNWPVFRMERRAYSRICSLANGRLDASAYSIVSTKRVNRLSIGSKGLYAS